MMHQIRLARDLARSCPTGCVSWARLWSPGWRVLDLCAATVLCWLDVCARAVAPYSRRSPAVAPPTEASSSPRQSERDAGLSSAEQASTALHRYSPDFPTP